MIPTINDCYGDIPWAIVVFSDRVFVMVETIVSVDIWSFVFSVQYNIFKTQVYKVILSKYSRVKILCVLGMNSVLLLKSENHSKHMNFLMVKM